MTPELVHRSKFLSLVLRHQPERIGVTLDAAGWIDVDYLLASCAAHGVTITRDQLDQIVATNDKKRFALSDDGLRIRASQGHSLEVELGYEPSAPPELLYHGTVGSALTAIRGDGLRPMARHAVHLSPDVTTATAVGGRRGEAIVLAVRAGEMHRDGHAFQVSDNGVWLTQHVPAKYLDLPIARAAGTPAIDQPSTGAGPGASNRRAIASETVAACDAGRYLTAAGATVEIGDALARAVAGTAVEDRATLTAIAIPTDRAGAIEVTSESTVEAVLRCAAAPGLGCLNFASARHIGGGFLRGAQAQEESIARCSGLYPCLMTCKTTYYAPNRAERSALYLDLVMISPDVPFFRDDAAGWLDAPVLATVITCAAPNLATLQRQGSPDADRVAEVVYRRTELLLRAAVAARVRTFVAGAWGAGVFGNDPAVVADAFAVSLAGDYHGAFDRVVFAILDGKPDQPVLTAFRSRLG